MFTTAIDRNNLEGDHEQCPQIGGGVISTGDMDTPIREYPKNCPPRWAEREAQRMREEGKDFISNSWRGMPDY